MSRIEESISKLKRFKYHAIGRLELEDAIDNVVSWYEQMMKDAVETEVTETCGISSVWIKTKQFKPGQKVRIIIVKED